MTAVRSPGQGVTVKGAVVWAAHRPPKKMRTPRINSLIFAYRADTRDLVRGVLDLKRSGCYGVRRTFASADRRAPGLGSGFERLGSRDAKPSRPTVSNRPIQASGGPPEPDKPRQIDGYVFTLRNSGPGLGLEAVPAQYDVTGFRAFFLTRRASSGARSTSTRQVRAHQYRSQCLDRQVEPVVPLVSGHWEARGRS